MLTNSQLELVMYSRATVGDCSLRIGNIVRITEGPFVGLLGRFAGTAGDQRVSVVVELRSCELAIELDLNWIAAAPTERKPISRIEAPEIRRWTKPPA